MPENEDPYRLQLPSDLQEELDIAICNRVRETVQACADRDDELKDFRLQLEGASEAGPLPWPGACTIPESISRELHTTTTAAMWSAAKQTPYVCLEPVVREDTDEASDKETWLTIKAQQFGYEKALYDAIYLANEGRYAPMYVGHKQAITRSYERKVSDPELPDDAPQEEGLVLKETPSEDLIEFRTPNPWDFYVFPISAFGPQVEHGCIDTVERMELTREDLTLGVLTEGYDEDKVKSMLQKGPASLLMDTTDDEDDRDGLNEGAVEQTSESGLWECFLVVGRAPLLLDDDNEPRIPDGMMHADCVWMCCPALSIVFKQTYSPFPDGLRPYAIYNVIDKPNRLLGEGIVSILTSTDDEMTSIVRFGINNMNLEASPMMSVAESWLARYSKWTVAPGRFMPRQASDPVGPKPVVWDVKSQQLIMPWLQYLDAKAGRLAASQSVNSAMAGRVRKAAEIHFAEQMQQTKFDLFLACIQRGVKDTFRIMSAILLQQMGESGETVFDRSTGRQVTVTPSELKGKFRFLPQASSDSVSPAQRLARQQTITQVVIQYWQGLPQFAQMGATSYWYALNHRLLVLSGERSPERYMGPEPEQQQGAPPMMPGMPGAPQGVQPPGFPSPDEGGGLLQASPFSPHSSNGNGALVGATG